jgi:acetyl esterase/lipase
MPLPQFLADLGLDALNLAEPRAPGRVYRGVAYGRLPRQRLDVYAPAAAVAAPVIVFLYGAGWRGGARLRHAFVGKRLAALGFVAVVPDYRLYPEVRFPAFVEDAAAAIAWSREHARRYGGDGGRVYLMGFSAGAHTAALLATDTQYLAAHGLVSRDLAGAVLLAGPYALTHEKLRHYRAIFAGAGGAARPAALVRRAPPPLLLMHGTADAAVAIAHTHRLAEAARGAGGRVVLREYEGLGHAGLLLALSRRFAGRAPVLDDLVAFVADQHERPLHRFAAAR